MPSTRSDHTVSRPFGTLIPLGRGRFRDISELPAVTAAAFPCTDELREILDAHVAPCGAPRFVVDLITGQTWAERETMGGGTDWTQVAPVLEPIHGLGTLLPHHAYDVTIWDRSGEAADLLSAATERPRDEMASAIAVARAITLTSLEIHRVSLIALQREESAGTGASPINAAARLGRLSLR